METAFRAIDDSWGPAAVLAAVGVGAFFASQHFATLGRNDHMTIVALSFVCFAITCAFLFLVTKWARSAMFPLFFLAFMIPLPEIAVDTLEEASKQASAEVASWLFLITGTPFLRSQTMFQLPGITITVAKECSGIRSTLVLIITSLLAAKCLPARWRHAVDGSGGWSLCETACICNDLNVFAHIGPHMIKGFIAVVVLFLRCHN
jgi:exosortase